MICTPLCVGFVCSKSNESINYDEYLDAGIPDSLLEGLGFYASSGDVEMSAEADEVPQIPDERPKSETIEESPSQTALELPPTDTGKFYSLFLF